MSSKFDSLKDLVEAKISHFPLEKRAVIVSCSGGVDSTVLFAVFCEFLKAKIIFSLSLFHFNYGLRGDESDGDETFCRDLALGAGVPFLGSRATSEQRATRQGEGVQAWARRLRRDALMQLTSGESDFAENIVTLAHHADDAAETVIMRLLRGTSLATMRGMAEWDGRWWRPWLDVSKGDILAAAGERGLLYREDSSNEKLDYARNVVRHKILPELLKLWPSGRQKILDLSEDAHTVSQYALGKALAECGMRLESQGGTGLSAVCIREALVALPESMAIAVLAHMAQSTSAGGWRQLSRANLLKVLGAANNGSGEQPRFVLEMSQGIFLEVTPAVVRAFSG